MTGASSGIGKEIARELARRGALPILVARTRSTLEDLADEIERSGAGAEVAACDLSDPDDVTRMTREILDVSGPPDILVNNAGAGSWRAIDEEDASYGEAAIRLPYLAAYQLTGLLVSAMIERGSGWILNVTSAAGYTTLPGANAYGVARWAMRAFSYQLEADLRGTGVGVSLLAAAEVESPYFDNNPGSRERIPAIAKLIGRMTPADVAREALDAIESERRERLIPARYRWMQRLTPPPLMRRLLALTGWKRS